MNLEARPAWVGVMYFEHSPSIWRDFPELVPGVLMVDGVTKHPTIDRRVQAFVEIAKSRLDDRSEAGLPEVQAWRRTFSAMGLKPTQYRCAAESLLRRLRKDGTLPRIHPLIDLCNAVSVAFAVPVAAFDVAAIRSCLEVRYAAGIETYETFSGEVETPEPNEVIYADGADQAHARRWTNRQSGRSAVRDTTRTVVIVAEAMHATAAADIEKLTGALADELAAAWSATPTSAVLTESAPRFEF